MNAVTKNTFGISFIFKLHSLYEKVAKDPIWVFNVDCWVFSFQTVRLNYGAVCLVILLIGTDIAVLPQ